MISNFLDVFRTKTAESTGSVLGRTGRISFVIALVLFVLMGPLALLISHFWLNILVRLLIFALFALSLDFVFGYTGLPSFGHAAMFGMGGFTSAVLLIEVTESALVVLPATFVSGMLIALVIGTLSVHTSEVYFAMITLAFAQILYLVAFNDVLAMLLGVESVTGGDNGLFGVPTVALPGLDTGSTIVYYYLTLAIVALSFVVLVRIANSPFGRVLLSISENEERAEFIGYDVTRYKIIAFTISGGFAGLAGGLFVSFQSIAHANLFFWTVSGEAILMVLVGGMGTLWGPMIGGGLIILLEEMLSGTEGWRLILGFIFVLIVIFAPTGLSGIIYSLQDDQPIPEKVKHALYSYIESIQR